MDVTHPHPALRATFSREREKGSETVQGKAARKRCCAMRDARRNASGEMAERFKAPVLTRRPKAGGNSGEAAGQTGEDSAQALCGTHDAIRRDGRAV